MLEKDYEKIAAMLRGLWPDKYAPAHTERQAAWLEGKKATLHLVADSLCHIFKADNERFDAGRFMDAVIPDPQPTEG